MDKEKLLEWAKNSLDYYNHVARELDLSFYQFQKPADFDNECNLLIVGINPGGGGTYDSQFRNTDACVWNSPTSDGMPRINEEGMTMAGFIAGNPCFGAEWSIFKGLSLIGLGKDRLDCIGNWQFINYIPFSTKNLNTFHNKAKGTDVLSRCISYTEEYIRILSPKRIIVLGTSSGIDCMKGKKDYKVLLHGRYRYIITSRICDIPSLAVPHPSWPAWSAEAREQMKRMIDLYLQDRETEIESIELKEIIHHHIPDERVRKIKAEIIRYLQECGMSDTNPGDKNDKTRRFCYVRELELTVSESEYGFIGIRHYIYNGKRVINHNYQRNGIAGEEVKAIRSILSRYGFDTNSDVWLGRKSFSVYADDSAKAVAEIVEEIKKLESELSKY